MQRFQDDLPFIMTKVNGLGLQWFGHEWIACTLSDCSVVFYQGSGLPAPLQTTSTLSMDQKITSDHIRTTENSH